METYERFDCDVLVVGGGGAAARAAIEAASRNAQVALISKGPIGRSGATPLAFTSYQAAFGYSDPRDNSQIHFEDTVREGRYLGDENLIAALVDEAGDRALDLQRYGVRFKMQNGKFYQAFHPGETYPRNLIIKNGGYGMMQGLRKEVRKFDNIHLFEDHIATKLLSVDGEVVGAVSLDLRTGDCRVFRAKSVILATGGYHDLWKRNDVSSDLAGDAIELAYRAGAELVDMEMVLFYPTIYFYSDNDQGLVVVYEWFLEERYLAGKLVNALGEEFLPEGKLPVRDRLSRAIFEQIAAGKATERGTVFMDVSRSSKSEQEKQEVFRELVGGPGKNLVNLGLDVTKDPIEVTPGIHYTLGGVKINERTETNLPGLYAAGEVSANIHGANRVSGNALAATQVFGARAGKYAAQRAAEIPLPESLQTEIQEEVHLVASLRDSKKDGARPIQIKQELKALMETYVGHMRDEHGLQTTLDGIATLRQECRGGLRVVDIPVYNNEWREALEVACMLDLAEVVTRSALLREESRGHHYRSEFPETDDKWQKHTSVRFQDGKPLYSTVPVVKLGHH